MAKNTITHGDVIEKIVFLGLPVLSILSFLAMWYFFGLLTGSLTGLFVFIVWLTGFTTVGTKERAVRKFFEHPYATTESGLRWIVPFSGALDKRTTEIVELEFPHEAGIITRAGKARDADGNEINGRAYGSVTIGAKVSLLFQYPKGDRLINSVVRLPSLKEDLINIFEEPVLDQVRTVGGDTVWINLVQRRAHFAKQVLKSIKEDKDGVLSSLLEESGLENVQIAIKSLTLPEEVKKSINAQERAELDRTGKVIDADAERQKRELEGKGTASAEKYLLDVITEKPDNMQAQALLTLIKMAQGPATTIFPLSTDLTNVLSKVLKGGGGSGEVDRALGMLTPHQREEVMKKIRDLLAPGGVK